MALLWSPASITAIRHKLNINNGDHESARTLHMNEIGVVEIATDSAIPLTKYSEKS